MRVAFVCSGRPDNLKYLKNNRDNITITLSQHGWEVINTPLTNIEDLNTRLQEYQKNTINEFLFFYTGHGDVSSRQQILKLQLPNSEIAINDILDSIFKYLNPKKQAIVLDACYSGTIKGLVPENNMEFLSSSQAIEESYEDNKFKASIFSYYFCEAISQNKMILSDISNYIASKDNRQKPLPMRIGSDSIKIGEKYVELDKEFISIKKNYFISKIFTLIGGFLILGIILFFLEKYLNYIPNNPKELSIENLKKEPLILNKEKIVKSVVGINLRKKISALDGYEIIKKGKENIFHSGVKINLTLSHNMKESQSIIIREININIINWNKDFSYLFNKINEFEIGGAGTINPRHFITTLFGNQKIKTKNNKNTYLGNNILGDKLLKLSIVDDVEEIKWQILLMKKGLYILNYDIKYSIGNKDNIFTSTYFKVAL